MHAHLELKVDSDPVEDPELSCRYSCKSGFRISSCGREKDSNVFEICYDDGRD
jgi:hypothetical protein